MMNDTQNTTALPRLARAAVCLVFFMNGAVFASWITHIPLIQHTHGLSESQLGLALFSLAGGAVAALSVSGALINRFGSLLVTLVSSVGVCILPAGIITAGSFTELAAMTGAFGAFCGAMDVAMNAQAVVVEKRWGAPIMSSFHGFFSLGGLAGAGVGSLAIAQGVSPLVHVAGVTAGLGVLAAASMWFFFPKRVEDAMNGGKGKGAKFAAPTAPVLGLCLLAFFCLLSEGAMGDWITVYMHNDLGASMSLAPMGFAAYSLTMAIGRLGGDPIVKRLGPVRIVRYSTAISCAGMLTALLGGSPEMALAGFALVGVGLSNVIPVLFSAAGRVRGVTPGSGIAAVATLGYLGFLAGPPVIGFAAEWLTLRVALGIVAASIGCVSVFAGIVGKEEDSEIVVAQGVTTEP